MIDVNARIKQLQKDAVLAISNGTAEQGVEQINTNHEAIKQLIRDVVAEVTPDIDEVQIPAGAHSSYGAGEKHGWNGAIGEIESKAKELLD